MNESTEPWKPDVATCREELSLFGVRLAAQRQFEKEHTGADNLEGYRAMADEALEWLTLLRAAKAQE